MREIGNTLFAVVCWDQDAQQEAVSIHVTRVAAEVRAEELRREHSGQALVIGPMPVQLEL